MGMVVRVSVATRVGVYTRACSQGARRIHIVMTVDQKRQQHGLVCVDVVEKLMSHVL